MHTLFPDEMPGAKDLPPLAKEPEGEVATPNDVAKSNKANVSRWMGELMLWKILMKKKILMKERLLKRFKR